MISILLMSLESETDRKKLTDIYHRYNKAVFYVALKIMKTQDAAEEVAQDVWTGVVEKFERISGLPDDELKPYLTVMTRNIAFNRLKSEKKRSAYSFEELQENGDSRINISAASGESAADVRYAEIVHMINNLPDIYKDVLELKYVLEWSNSEISSLLGISAAKVAVRAFRGRKVLVNQLNKLKGAKENGGKENETCRA